MVRGHISFNICGSWGFLHHRGVFVSHPLISITWMDPSGPHQLREQDASWSLQKIIVFLRQAGVFLLVGHYVALILGDFGSISDRFCPVWTEALCFRNDFVLIWNKPSANVWSSCFTSLDTLGGSVYKLQRHKINSGWHLFIICHFPSFSLCFFHFFIVNWN